MLPVIDFGARYYASNLGRFMTPDWSSSPEAVPYADLTNPQSLNLYAYVGNNPVTNVDKDGHICFLGIGNCNPGPPPLPRGPLPPNENHTITVTEVRGHSVNVFGHVVVSVDGGTKEGLNPNPDPSGARLLAEATGIDKTGTPGIVKPPDTEVLSQVNIPVDADQAKAAQRAIEAGVANGGNYHVTDRNCVTFCQSVLGAAGIQTTNHEVTPAALLKDLWSFVQGGGGH